MRSFYVADQEIIRAGSAITAVVLSAGGEIDYAASPKLRELLSAATRCEGAPLIVDLSGATFIDSTAIGVLVTAASKLEEEGMEMAVVCTDPQILNIFAIVGLSDILGIFQSRDEAISSLVSVA